MWRQVESDRSVDVAGLSATGERRAAEQGHTREQLDRACCDRTQVAFDTALEDASVSRRPIRTVDVSERDQAL